MPLKQGCLQVEKKANIFIPVRLAKRKEIKELLCGTSYCPACDCEVVGERLMNKLPIISSNNNLEGWLCSICDSMFDLNDKLLTIGDFDIFSQNIGEA